MATIYAALDGRLVVTAETTDWQCASYLDGYTLESVAAAPNRTFVGTVENGLQRRIAGGEFERVGAGTIDDRVTAIAVSPHDPETIWAGTEPSRIYRSRDGGGTWEHRSGLADLPSASEWSFPPRPETHHVRWIEPDPHDPGRLYVAIEAGAFVRTDDAGETWQDRPDGARLDNHTVGTHPDAPGRIYVAAGDGYAESTDGGDTWTYPQTGLEHRYVWSVAIDPADPTQVVVSAASTAQQAHRTGEAFVYRRTGDGEWRQDMNGITEGATRAVLTRNQGESPRLQSWDESDHT